MRPQLLAAAFALVGICAFSERAAAQVYSYTYAFPGPVPYVYPSPIVYTSPTYPLVRTYSTPVVYSTYTAPIVIPTRAWVVAPAGATTDAKVAVAGTAAAAAGTAATAGGVAAAVEVTAGGVNRANAVAVAGPPVFQLGYTTYTPIVAPVAAPYVAGTPGAVYYYSPYGYGTYNAFSGPYMSVGFGHGYGGWGYGRGWGYASWGYSW